MVIGTGTLLLGAAAAGGLASAMSGGQKPQRSTQTTTRDVPAWLQPYMEESVQRGVDISQTPYEAYTGERVAGLSPDELQAIELTRGMVGEQDPRFAQAQDIMGQVAQRGLGGFAPETLQQYINPYQEQVMDISRQRQLEEFQRAQTGLQQQQGQIGAFGGSRSALAQSELQKNYARQQAEMETQQLYGGYSDAMTRAMAGTQMAGQAGLGIAGLAGQQQQAGLQGISALGGVGELQRGIGQRGLDIGYQDFLTQQQYPYQQAQFAQSFINPAAGLTTGQTTTGVSTPGQPGPFQAALGTGMMAAGMMGGGGGGGSFWGTAPGTPMSGGYQGPTQGSGVRGFFGFEEGGEVSLASLGIDPSLYEGIGKGRKLPPELYDPMKYEEEDLLARDPDMAAMLLAGAVNDPVLDVPMSPGGLTRREMMQVWEGEGLGSYELGQGYIEGGIVKKQDYACGGKVKGYQDGGTIQNPGLSRWEQFTDFFAPPGGYQTFEEQQARQRQQALESPKVASVLGKYITSPERPSYAEAKQMTIGGMLTRQEDTGITPPLPEKRPEVNKQVKDLLSTMGVSRPSPVEDKGKKDTMNLPLLNFGAAMLGSRGNFFQALGEAGKSYATTKMTQQQAMQEAASDALKRKLEERRLAAYELQTRTAAEKAPLGMEMQRLKIAQMMKKLEDNPMLQKLYLEERKAMPMDPVELSLEKAMTGLKGLKSTTGKIPAKVKEPSGWKFLGAE